MFWAVFKKPKFWAVFKKIKVLGGIQKPKVLGGIQKTKVLGGIQRRFWAVFKNPRFLGKIHKNALFREEVLFLIGFFAACFGALGCATLSGSPELPRIGPKKA